MSTNNLVYNRGKFLVGQGRVTTTAAFRTMLCNTGYTADADHNLVDDGTTSDPASYEITVSGYARQSLASITLTEDDTNEFAYLDAADAAFGALAAGQTVRWAVNYVFSSSGGTTSDTGQELLAAYEVSTGGHPTSTGTLTVQWASSSQGGFLKLGTTS